MIRCKELRAGYRTGFRRRWREVLAGVTFHVPKGSVTGYLGVNGAGKTTTIKVLVGINPPSGGTVEIGGHPAGHPAAQRLVGYFPEAPFFYDALTGAELLEFYGRLGGLDRTALRAAVPKLLDDVGLGGVDVPVRGYSKGMRQRLGLAQALVHDPELLVLDEPLDGLDPMGRLHLRGLIAAQAKRGKTVFFSSHVLPDVETTCDRIVVLDGSRVAYEGPTAGLLGGEAPRVEVLASAGDDAARAALEAALSGAAGAAPERRPDGALAVVALDAATADRTIDAVRAAGARVLAVTPLRPSLEETFLRRFGRSAPPGGGGGPA